MKSTNPKKIFALAAATTTLLALSPSAASAAPPSAEPEVRKDGLISPLHLAVGSDKNIAVSESFAGNLTEIGKKGRSYTAQEGWSVGGADYLGTKLYFLESIGAGEDPLTQAGALKVITAGGKVTTVTDQLADYERTNNPDQVNQYGLSPADAVANPECVAQLEAGEVPGSYPGALDSHPYGLAVKGNTAYIADAGANAVLSVHLKSGEISTVAVLPPQPVVISEEFAEENGVLACAGLTYNFEPVPTDVEIGPHRALYVSTLPGGPEDPSLGARGAVYRVDSSSGAYTKVVENVLSPTGIALDPRGAIYIASLFGGEILKVPAGGGTPSPVLTVPLPADVEINGSTLYATTDALSEPPNGKIISKRI